MDGSHRGETEATTPAADEPPLTRLHVLILGVCALGLACDMAEMALNGVLSAVFSSPPHSAAPNALAWLLAATYVGAIFGAPLVGRVADRFGRRPVLAVILVAFAVTSFLAGGSSGLNDLTWLRGACGVALGAYPPVMIAYLTDFMPPRRRGQLLLTISGVATLGPPAAIFLTRWLTPMSPLGVEGWRWALFVFGVLALLAAGLFLRLPESPVWLARVGRNSDAADVALRFERSQHVEVPRPVGQVVQPAGDDEIPRPGTKTHLVVSSLFLLSPWPTVAFPILSGAVLVKKGVNLADALMFVGASALGPLVASVIVAPLIDRLGRRRTMALCAVGMLLAGSVFAAGAEPAVLVTSNLVFGMLMAIYIPTITTYGAELYPTASRGFAVSGFWALNRLGSAVAPLVLLPLLFSHGPITMFAVIAVATFAGLVLLLAAPRGRAGRAVA